MSIPILFLHYDVVSHESQVKSMGFQSLVVRGDRSSNLLEANSFKVQLQQLEEKVPQARLTTWQQAKTWATESQQFAERICVRDPLLQVELLEAMHTVLSLIQHRTRKHLLNPFRQVTLVCKINEQLKCFICNSIF